jgi:ABC-2 type transport system permease protein
MSDVGLALRQVKYENRSFWRNPASAFFTFVFPVMFMVIFNLIFGKQKYSPFGPGATVSDFYTPAIMAFAVITACYTNLAMGVTFARENGVLKRSRGTPLPSWAYLFGRIANSIIVSVLLVVIVGGFGAAFYHVRIPTHTLPGLVSSLAVGAATFASLGLAITAFVPNADAAPAVVNVSIFPLLFISDIFIPLQNAPTWLGKVADVFPIKHLSDALKLAYDPRVHGNAFAPKDLWVMGIWAVAGIAIAMRRFRWEPRAA